MKLCSTTNKRCTLSWSDKLLFILALPSRWGVAHVVGIAIESTRLTHSQSRRRANESHKINVDCISPLRIHHTAMVIVFHASHTIAYDKIQRLVHRYATTGPRWSCDIQWLGTEQTKSMQGTGNAWNTQKHAKRICYYLEIQINITIPDQQICWCSSWVDSPIRAVNPSLHSSSPKSPVCTVGV